MSQTYQARRRAQQAPAEQKFGTSVPGPSIQELAAGAMPSTEQMGHRVDLPDAIREKMEASFGADFSGVKLYESQTVADAGANAMTMGSNVAFAPGQLDLASTSGQALLGHELSHVVSQARGESAGQGFLADAGLEAQADRQGALAAQGESVYTGPVTPLSASAVPASAAGPMQAAKESTVEAEKEAALEGKQLPSPLHFIQRGRAKQEYLGKRDERMRVAGLAADAIGRANGQMQAARKAYSDAAERFAGSKEAYASRARYATRYLETGLLNRGEQEQQDILRAFSRSGTDADLAPYLIEDIRRYGQVQQDRILSNDPAEMLKAYGDDALVGMHQADIAEVIFNPDFDRSQLVGEGKLTQEELDAFEANQYNRDISNAHVTATALQMMGSDETYAAGRSAYNRTEEQYWRNRRGGH